MKRLVWLALTGALFLLAANSPAAPRPNIVHILTDDLGWQDPACYYRDVHGEDPIYETPNMDRLAEHGTRFMQAYSPAPSCSPSRAAYMAGQWTTHTRVVHVGGGLLPRAYHATHAYIDPFYPSRLNIKTPIIADVLKEAGYLTGHVAKWHLGGKSDGYPGPVDHGFDFAWLTGRRHHWYNDPDVFDPSDRKRANFGGVWSAVKPRHTGIPSSRDPADMYALGDDDRPFDSVVDLALRWLDKAKDQGQPFFLNFCPFFVHGPITTRDRKRLAHYCEKMGVPFPTDPGRVSDRENGQVNPYYAAMVDTLDWQVGRVLTFLEQTDDPRNPGHKLIDNTYVILSADNGGCIGLPVSDGQGKGKRERVTDNSPLRAGKQEVYEGGIRIPFIVRGPGVSEGGTCDTPIHLIDMFPTFLAMAGAKQHADLELDGCNVLPVFLGKDTKARFADGRERQSLFFHYPVVLPVSSVIRKGGWKLLLYHGEGMDRRRPTVQLFRLYDEDGSAKDLGETEDLADAHRGKRDELLAELKAWLKKYDAVLPYKNANTPGKFVPGSDRVPAIVKRHSEGDRVAVTVQTGDDKSRIVEAVLLYTTNGSDLLCERRSHEEWFETKAAIKEGCIEAVAPPGMTHGVFYLRDENGFLVTSEPIPPLGGQGADPSFRGSAGLKDGYAFRPGLASLINAGLSAETHAREAGLDTSGLRRTIRAAQTAVEKPVEEKLYATAMRDLRRQIRTLDVPEAKLSVLNQFSSEKWQ